MPEIQEDQYRNPTKAYTSRINPNRASINPSTMHGPDKKKPPKKAKKPKKPSKSFTQKIDEALGYPPANLCRGVCGTLTGDLVAHDNATIIPKGAEVHVVDLAHTLADITYDGTTINVDSYKLSQVFEPSEGENLGTFTTKLDKLLIDPDILFTVGK